MGGLALPPRHKVIVALMTILKPILRGLGTLLLVLGLLWMLQGFGIVRWPANSFMIDATPWRWRGGLVALLGALLIWGTRRR